MVRAAPTGIYKPGGGLVRRGGVSPVKKSGALAGRLGVRPGSAGTVGDARSKIGGGKISDARDVLSAKGKGLDARQKLEKMRNLKDGNLEVKKVGGITVTKKVGGKIELSTKTKAALPPMPPGVENNTKTQQIGRLTKTVSSSGKVSLSSKSGNGAGAASAAAGGRPAVRSGALPRSRSEGGAGVTGSVLRGAGGEKENRGVRNMDGMVREIDRLDQELLTTEVDPKVLHRTVETSRRQHVRRERSRSPMERDRSPIRGRPVTGFADARRSAQREERDEGPRTMGSRLDGNGTGVSPLQGTKIVIQNLQTSVTQEDILELFGDIGALRRAKMVNPGHAEVTFINKADAARAVEIYHNRQLDGKPMKCTMVGVNNAVAATGGPTMALPKMDLPVGKERKGPIPDMDSIHRALFNKKSAPGKKQTFTITMPKKSKDEQDRW